MSKSRKVQNLAKGIAQYMGGRGYQPMGADQLFAALDIPAWLHEVAHEALSLLVEQEEVIQEGERYLLAHQSDAFASGVIRVHPRGFGFVVLEGNRPDVFIPRQMILGAVDGDTVEIEITGDSPKGPDGRVVRIIDRARSQVAGIVVAAEGNWSEIFAPLLGPERRVEVMSEEPLEVGDRIVATISKWGSAHETGEGTLLRKIGHIDQPSCDIAAALEEFEIRHRFPKGARDEAKGFGDRVTPSCLKGRRDLRESISVTIDPETAKDFDDALSLRKDRRGHYHLDVHIADVSHYVQPGSALDKEALKRCNSTYFPGRCVPMLPPELADNLCSLRPDVNRLTVSVFMEFDKKGDLIDYAIERSVIRSSKRFSYEEAKRVLEGEAKSPHAKLLKLMVELCGLLKRKRRARGTVEFALPELSIVVDGHGKPTGTRTSEYDITHQMVEEFMLKANEVVATHLAKLGRGLTYRIHEEPDPESLREFAQLATAFGFRLSPTPTADEIQELFDKAIATPYGPLLTVAFIRSMKLAAYSPDNIGHYGLSLEHYCHFTSPIRRYADLIVHRALLEEEEIDEGELAMRAKECSERERISARAEQSVTKLKKLRLLQKIDEAEPEKRWEAVVTHVKPFGLFFELAELQLEGFIHISKLGHDWFEFDEKRLQLVAEKSGMRFRCGDPIAVHLLELDLTLGEMGWELLGSTKEARRKKR